MTENELWNKLLLLLLLNSKHSYSQYDFLIGFHHNYNMIGLKLIGIVYDIYYISYYVVLLFCSIYYSISMTNMYITLQPIRFSY